MTFEHRISGHDFVRAMLVAGYRLIGATGGRALLSKGEVELWVPQRAELPEEETLALLAKADMQPLRLVALLNRLESRDTWPAQGDGDVLALADGVTRVCPLLARESRR